MQYKIITEDRFEDVLHHLREFFFFDEPLNKAVNLCKPGEGHPELEDYVYMMLHHNLSIMGVNENDKIVGVRLNAVLINRNYVDLSEKELDSCGDENYKKIIHLFNELNKRANIFEKFDVDKIFELRILSVDPNYRGKGIAKEMVSRSEQVARDYGFKLMKAEATGAFSEKVFKANGFTVLEEQYYDKWCDESGIPILNVEPPHTKIQLLYKVLD